MLWANRIHSKDAQVLPPDSCQCDLTWKQSLQEDRVKMMSSGGALIEQNQTLDTETDVHPGRMSHEEEGDGGG